jgi:hypothetical protein
MKNVYMNKRNKNIYNQDFYATSPEAAEWLCKLEKFNGPIWECACGEGHLAKVFEKNGYLVKSTDLVDRGYGSGGVDFLKFEPSFYLGNIVTNPPFKFAEEFIWKGLELISKGKKLCLFLRILFLEGKKRERLFSQCPPKIVYVSRSRIWTARNGRFNLMKGSMVGYSWFVWVKGFKGNPIIKWFN